MCACVFYVQISNIKYRNLDIAGVEAVKYLRRESSDETLMLCMAAFYIGKMGLVLLGKRVCVNL